MSVRKKEKKMASVTNPKNVLRGDHVSFVYNGKIRTGTVENVAPEWFTLSHDEPVQYNDKQYSNYSFKRLGSQVSLV